MEDILYKLKMLFSDYEDVVKEINNVIEKQPRYYKAGIISAKLNVCGKKSCHSCPHSYTFVISGNKGEHSQPIGKTITRQILTKYGREKAYPYLKAVETDLKYAFKKREKILAKITAIRRILKSYS